MYIYIYIYNMYIYIYIYIYIFIYINVNVIIGAVNALQLKVILLHNQWSKIQVFIMFLSVGGMLAYFGMCVYMI
jgi:hypothetical protein